VNHVLDRIASERKAQDAKWGGPSHDDDHAADEWVGFIQDYLDEADSLIGNLHGLRNPDDAFCRRMVQIAALAVACVQRFDRHHKREVPAETVAEAALRAERAEVKRLREAMINAIGDIDGGLASRANAMLKTELRASVRRTAESDSGEGDEES
jgi:hypothetical protein